MVHQTQQKIAYWLDGYEYEPLIYTGEKEDGWAREMAASWKEEGEEDVWQHVCLSLEEQDSKALVIEPELQSRVILL